MQDHQARLLRGGSDDQITDLHGAVQTPAGELPLYLECSVHHRLVDRYLRPRRARHPSTSPAVRIASADSGLKVSDGAPGDQSGLHERDQSGRDRGLGDASDGRGISEEVSF